MNWYLIFGGLVFWNIAGFVCLFVWGCKSYTGPMGNAKGLEFLNPLFIYQHARVNWFGTLCLTLLWNLMCPGLSISYWFYKLCTCGRK